MDITIPLIFQPIFNLVVILYRLFDSNLGLAIIAIGIISRIVTLPIVLRQRRSMVKGKEMSAKVSAIKELHKDDKERQQKEVMAIQSEYLPGQIAGCLPLILQVIIFLNIYNVIRALIIGGATSFNKLAYSFVPPFSDNYKINYNFLNILDLSKRPSELANNLGALFPYLIVLILVGITQYFSMKYMTSINNPVTSKLNNTNSTDLKLKNSKKNKNKNIDKKEENPAEDFSSIIAQSGQQTLILLPIFYMFIGYSSFESGLGVYWIVTNTFVIIQQLILTRNKKANLDKIALIMN